MRRLVDKLARVKAGWTDAVRNARRAAGLWLVLLALGASGAASLGAAPARAADAALVDPDQALAVALEQSLKAPGLRGARLAALVVDAQDGRVLFAHQPDRALIPASNLKVLTAIAALHHFGPTHRFTTRVHSDGPPDAEGAVDTLYVVGGGDPGLTSEDLWRLAADLRQLGLRRVRGDLVIDDSLFDGAAWHPSWLPVTSRAYHAPVGALTVNYGAFAVAVVASGPVGSPVAVSVDPPIPYLSVVNEGTTGERGSRARGAVDRRRGQGVEEVVVGGAWPQGDARTYYRSVIDPAAYAAHVLVLQLKAVGVSFEGAVRRAYLPEDRPLLLAFEGRPLSDVVNRFLKFSSNPTGEALIKALGADERVPGGWRAGTAAVRRELEELGLPLESLVMADGSGLSRRNRVSPRLLVAALRTGSQSFRFGSELVAGLPIGAADGTLRRRAEVAGDRVRAKTGLLTGVTGLSGYAQRADGSLAIFSLLVNGARNGGAAMAAVDGFAAALVETGAPAQEEPRGE